MRSFTLSSFEVSGAGHNLLGAVGLAMQKGRGIFDKQNDGEYVRMKDKNIGMSLDLENPDAPLIGVKQQPVTIGQKVPPALVGTAIGLTPEMLTLNGWQPVVASTEVAHLMVPVSNSIMLNRATVNKGQLHKLAENLFSGVVFVYN